MVTETRGLMQCSRWGGHATERKRGQTGIEAGAAKANSGVNAAMGGPDRAGQARHQLGWVRPSGTPAGGTCVSSKQSCAARLSRRAAAEVRSLLGGPGSGNSVWFGRSERVKIRIDRAAAVEVRDVNG